MPLVGAEFGTYGTRRLLVTFEVELMVGAAKCGTTMRLGFDAMSTMQKVADCYARCKDCKMRGWLMVR